MLNFVDVQLEIMKKHILRFTLTKFIIYCVFVLCDIELKNIKMFVILGMAVVSKC